MGLIAYEVLLVFSEQKQAEAYYGLYKDLYYGSAEWDSKFPIVLHRLRVLGK